MKMDETKRSLVVAQDIKLVKALSGNNPKLRDRALRNLQKWFEQRSIRIAFTEEEFLRIWKGLFYAMWMSDKPLIQEECAEKIAHLLHFPNAETSLLFFKCSLTVLSTEWFGIDQLRLDKFLLFVRRILRQALCVLRNNHWQLSLIDQFGEILFETVLQNDNNNHLGLTMHITEIYFEELAKVSKGQIDSSLMTGLLKPFVKQLATLNDDRLINHMKKYLFQHLLYQSDQGIEYQMKFQAWKGEGFPGGSIDSMQNVREFDSDGVDETFSDEDSGDQPLDPRAGEVNVDLPQLQFNSKQIVKLLLQYRFVDGSNTKSRRAITDLVKKFKELSKGKFPLGMKKISIPDDDGYSTSVRKSVNRLVKFEKQLIGNNRKRKLKDRKDESAIVTPAKKIKIATNNQENSSNHFQKKLDKFIQKSEGSKIKTPIREAKLINIPTKTNSNSALIKRNSGTWLVETLDTHESGHSPQQKTNNTKAKTNHIKEDNNIDTKTASIFPNHEWDLPPKEGEVEIFVPSNKYKKKIDSIAKKSGKQTAILLKESLDKLVKPRYSLDSKLVKNPFAQNKFVTPRSEKKVKINLRLNSSQEIYEHRAQLRRSPAIPFDADKKPNKPLLKSNINSPINPFSKKLL